MVEVRRGEHESVERLISRFRQRVLKKGILKQVRYQRFHHRKPNRRSQKLRAARREQSQTGQDELFLFEKQGAGRQGASQVNRPDRSRGQRPSSPARRP